MVTIATDQLRPVATVKRGHVATVLVRSSERLDQDQRGVRGGEGTGGWCEETNLDCQGLVPQVPHVAGYNPKNLDTVRFPPAANGWGSKYPASDMPPPLLAREEGPPT
jgi:hypothetical protein